MNSAGRRQFLNQTVRMTMGLGATLSLSALSLGCQSMGAAAQIGTTLAQQYGVISNSQATSILKSSQTISKTFEDISPEQEYYLGRSIGAKILQKYSPWSDQKANRYINLLGTALSQVSDCPETFGGYHFLVLDSRDINAFAAPGGFVFVTRGLLQCCKHEDAVASVLAHEIGHVQSKDGLRAIKTSRLTTALTVLGVEGSKNLGSSDLSKVASDFEGAIADVSQTLINSGYSKTLEYEADRAATLILTRCGYDPNGLVEMLRGMGKRLKPGRGDFFTTHPTPKNRIAKIQKCIGSYRPVQTPAKRQARFKMNMRNII